MDHLIINKKAKDQFDQWMSSVGPSNQNGVDVTLEGAPPDLTASLSDGLLCGALYYFHERKY